MTPAEARVTPWLHLYAQSHAHSPAELRGTRAALLELRQAIDRALADPNGEAEFSAMTSDGEGYGVEVRRVPRSTLWRSRLPYAQLDGA